MRTRNLRLVAWGLAALLAAAARAEGPGDDPFSGTRQTYDALRRESESLREEMNGLRRVYENDPEVMAAEKASDAAQKVYDEALKASSAIARAREAQSAARKRFDEAVQAALAADAQAAPLFRRHEEVVRRLEAIKSETQRLMEEEKKLRRELAEHRMRVYRDPKGAGDARAAMAAAEKTYSEAVKGDPAVQEARKAYEEAKQNHFKIRDAKLAADPLYAELAEKYRAVDAKVRAMREGTKPRRREEESGKRGGERGTGNRE